MTRCWVMGPFEVSHTGRRTDTG